MRKRFKEIQPELIEIGDTISVTHKREQGIVLVLEGTVAKRQDSGNVRYLLTVEGGTLLAWEPGRKGVRVTLLSRPESLQPQITFINDFLEETRERIGA